MLHEQRYKRLMHLLSKSQFYSSYLVNKIEKCIEKEQITKKKNKVIVENDENKPPKKKSLKKANLRNYKMQKYISKDVSSKEIL